MQFPSITLCAAGFLGLLFIVLCIRVVRLRLATGTSLGDGSGPITMGQESNSSPLFVAVRTHANFAEYVPLSLLLLLLVEVVGAPSWLVISLAGMLVLARLLHPVGMLRPAPNPFRAGGIMLQWTMLGATSIYALLLGYTLQ